MRSEIVDAATLQNDADMDFGDIIPSGTTGTVVMTPALAADLQHDRRADPQRAVQGGRIQRDRVRRRHPAGQAADPQQHRP